MRKRKLFIHFMNKAIFDVDNKKLNKIYSLMNLFIEKQLHDEKKSFALYYLIIPRK